MMRESCVTSISRCAASVAASPLIGAAPSYDAADAAVARGDDLPPLHGVPMTIKDSFQTEGCITTSGSPDLARYVPPQDAWPDARSSATGLGGRSRKLKDQGERARKAVTARIRESIQRIAEAHPAAGEHFAAAVRTGSFCCYEPNTAVDWRL